MAKVTYNGNIEKVKRKEEDRIKQGDYVYCEAMDGANSFWGVYSAALGTVIDLDGAGDSYIKGKSLYLNDTYTYWTITKRISCDKVKIIIEEIN